MVKRSLLEKKTKKQLRIKKLNRSVPITELSSLRLFTGAHEKKKKKSLTICLHSRCVLLVCDADSECRPIPSTIIYVCFPFYSLLDIFIFDPHLQNE